MPNDKIFKLITLANKTKLVKIRNINLFYYFRSKYDIFTKKQLFIWMFRFKVPNNKYFNKMKIYSLNF